MEQELEKMPKEEKKSFLKMDLAHRMMKVEQSVCASFRKKVPLEKTEYYRSLTPEEKEDFKKFLKNKITKKMLILTALIPIILIFLLNFNITGSIVMENIGYNAARHISNFLVVLTLIFIVVLIYSAVSSYMLSRKLNSHIKIIKPFLARKYVGV